MIKTKPQKIFYEDEFKGKRVFLAHEYLDEHENIFPSVQKMVSALYGGGAIREKAIVFCPHCGAGAREEDWRFKQKSARNTLHTGQCPNCGERIQLRFRHEFTAMDALEYHEGQCDYIAEYISSKTTYRIPKELEWWPVDDGKLTFQAIDTVVSAVTTMGNYFLKREHIQHRVIFNLKTGHCYTMQGLDTRGKKTKHSLQALRLMQCSLSTINTVLIPFQDDMMKIVLDEEKKYHESNLDIVHGKKGNYLIGDNVFTFGKLATLNYFFTMKPRDMVDFVTLNKEARFSRRKDSFSGNYPSLKLLSSRDEVNWLPKYMQKKSIRSRLLKRAIVFYLYKWLHKCGVKDINIMNRIVDSCIDKSSEDLIKIIYTFCDKEHFYTDFVKWCIVSRTPESIYALIVSLFKDTHASYDAANMYSLLRYSTALPDASHGNLKEVHDLLTDAYNKYRFGNLTIPYTPEEQALESSYQGFDFKLPVDTDTLYDIGTKLNICVGSYGRRAVRKDCTIVTMSKEDKYIACIELRQIGNQLKMYQLKSRFNHTVKEIEPVTEWATNNDILVDCYDYQNAVNHTVNGFDNQEVDYHVDNPRLVGAGAARVAPPFPFEDDGNLPF